MDAVLYQVDDKLQDLEEPMLNSVWKDWYKREDCKSFPRNFKFIRSYREKFKRHWYVGISGARTVDYLTR